jgi:hypothetical protein
MSGTDSIRAKVEDGGSATQNETIEFTVDWDAVTIQYPDQVTEIYEARFGGIAAPVLETITLVYANPDKRFLLSAVRV